MDKLSSRNYKRTMCCRGFRFYISRNVIIFLVFKGPHVIMRCCRIDVRSVAACASFLSFWAYLSAFYIIFLIGYEIRIEVIKLYSQSIYKPGNLISVQIGVEQCILNNFRYLISKLCIDFILNDLFPKLELIF